MIIRTPTNMEMDSLFMLGYDAWGDGLPESEYLHACHGSAKYKKGIWHILVDDGQIISALITYQNDFNLPHNCYGIGSVATHRLYRKQGYAALLIKEVLASLQLGGALAVYLFSDIEPDYYKKLGFTLVNQKEKCQSCCMMRKFVDSFSSSGQVPSYF